MDKVLDFAQFLNYKTVEVPVQCGTKTGKIYTFSHKDYLKNGLLKNYKDELKNLIERKKYFDSEKFCHDIGPAVAAANLIEDGEYATFVRKFNNGNLKLTGLEHVLRVEETINEKEVSYSILPLDEECDFINQEQDALIRYSIFFKRLTDPNKETNEGAIEWIFGGNGNAKLFREKVLLNARVQKIENYSRIYSNCVIYKNLFGEIINIYSLKEKDIENTKNIKDASEIFERVVI